MALLRAREKTTVAETVASIDDLLIELLIRLPTKSLLRFKSVSKHWQSLITNPQFSSKRHRNSSCLEVGLFFHQKNFFSEPYGYLPFKSLTHIHPIVPNGCRVSQSCHGLLLLWKTSTNIPYIYCVYNPTTRKIFILPIPEPITDLNSKWFDVVKLAFDPRKSPYFKVLHVKRTPLKSLIKIEVFSSDTGTWRVVSHNKSCPWPSNSTIEFYGGVYWNNAINWINLVDGDSIYYDFGDDSFKTMPMPPIVNKKVYSVNISYYNSDGSMGNTVPLGYRKQNYYFGVSCDHLHYIEFTTQGVQSDIYELKRDYSEWFVRYIIDLSTTAYPEITLPYNSSCILCVVRGEKEKDSFLALRFGKKFVMYNLVYKTLEELNEFDEMYLKQLIAGHLDYFQYIENFS